MKIKLITFTILASSAFAAFSQGTVLYNNIVGAKLAPILITPAHPTEQLQGQPSVSTAASAPLGATDYGPGAVGAAGTGFTAELWAGADAGSLAVVTGSQTPLRSGGFAGYITQIATLPIAQIVPGASGTLQIRAWANAGGVNSWALAAAGLGLRGMSAPFVNSTGGAGTPASSPASLTLLTSFNLYTVPEPSLIALGALGLGALLLRRRKA